MGRLFDIDKKFIGPLAYVVCALLQIRGRIFNAITAVFNPRVCHKSPVNIMYGDWADGSLFSSYGNENDQK